jgi:hypothetical protein
MGANGRIMGANGRLMGTLTQLEKNRIKKSE